MVGKPPLLPLEITYDESVVYMKTEIYDNEDQISLLIVIFGKND